MVTADIMEPANASGVDTVLFSYRVNTDPWWNTTLVFNETLGQYEQTIPGLQKNDTVEYFAKVTDNAEKANTTETHYYTVASVDINSDDIVDIYDLNIVGRAYGSFVGDPRYSLEQT